MNASITTRCGAGRQSIHRPPVICHRGRIRGEEEIVLLPTPVLLASGRWIGSETEERAERAARAERHYYKKKPSASRVGQPNSNKLGQGPRSLSRLIQKVYRVSVAS